MACAMFWPGMDWYGLAWPGLVWPSMVWSGLACPGLALLLIGLKLATLRSEEKWDEQQSTTNNKEHSKFSAISASSLTWLD